MATITLTGGTIDEDGANLNGELVAPISWGAAVRRLWQSEADAEVVDGEVLIVEDPAAIGHGDPDKLEAWLNAQLHTGREYQDHAGMAFSVTVD